MTCPDRTCNPDRGDEGCMAHLVNVGAFDALDFIWTSAWDGCPLIAKAEQRQEKRQQYDDWFAKQERAAEAGGAFS